MMISARADAACPALPGTFLQLTYAKLQRPPSEWQRLFRTLREVGVQQLFLQWTVVDNEKLFLQSGMSVRVNTNFRYILQLAANEGMRIWVGLVLDSHYWEQIKNNAAAIDAYFQRRLTQLSQVAGEIAAATAVLGFAGWYITDEIDDRTWLDADKGAALKKYLRETIVILRKLRPGSEVAISGFTNLFADPELLASFWQDLMAASGLNVLLFQDGIGEGKARVEDIALYYRALSTTLPPVGRQFAGVVELFALQPGGQRVPAPLQRLLQQIDLAERYANFPVVAFSVPDYMSEFGGPAAAALLSGFVAARGRCARG